MRNDLVWHLLDITLNLGICELAADQSLGGEKGVLGVYDSLTLRGDTDQTLTILQECDN